uniref:Uncharacterized protein n=1 Tax=Arundo donax TaxID=35708 RepID=A0A0A8Z8L3_ARUDO
MWQLLELHSTPDVLPASERVLTLSSMYFTPDTCKVPRMWQLLELQGIL